MTSRILKTYKNATNMHGINVHKIATDMYMEKHIHFHLEDMTYLTGNMYFNIVPTVKLLLYLLKIRIVLKQICPTIRFCVYTFLSLRKVHIIGHLKKNQNLHCVQNFQQ